MARPRTPRRDALRRRLGVGGVAALAGLTAAVGLAAGAHAATAPSPDPGANASLTPSATATPTVSPTPTGSGGTATSAAPTTGPSGPATAPPRKVAVEPQITGSVAPNYGYQKFRIGVQIASGAYVPTGTSTVGTVVSVIETGPNAPEPNAQTCTTIAPVPADPSSTTSYCNFPADVGAEQYYLAQPGDTVTIKQSTVEPGLVTDPTTHTLLPCLAGVDSPFCTTATSDVLFTDPGIPPTAAADAATTLAGTPVDIAVLGNDDTFGAPPTLTVATPPADGTAVFPAQTAATSKARTARAVGPLTVLYTPKAGFVGHDAFTYRLTTANGTATALVSITVTAPPPTAVNDTAATTSGTSTTIAVLGNDDAHGGGTLTIASVGTPSHGAARIDGTDIVYTPVVGYVGTDSFPYTVTTAFGTATAVVTVTVTAPVIAPAAAVTTETALPFTGLPADGLLEIAGGLLLAGGAARVAARRRRRS